MDRFRELSPGEKFASLFNGTALELGILTGVWHLVHRNWLETSVIFLILVPLYFFLVRLFDAP